MKLAPPKEPLLDRFVRYAKIDTQSQEDSDTYPSTKKQFDLLNLLLELREENDFAMLLISHDPRLIRIASDWVVVLDEGRVVERGATRQVLVDPQHPTTRSLLASSRTARRAASHTE